MQRSKRRNERFSLSLSLTHFYFYPPRRGGARVERSDLDKKRREKKKKRWLRGRRRSKYVLSAFNDYFILTGEFISGLHYRAWPAPRRRSYVLSRLSFFFFIEKKRRNKCPEDRRKGRRTNVWVNGAFRAFVRQRSGLLFPILFQNTSKNVRTLSRFPRSFLNKFRSETRPSPL